MHSIRLAFLAIYTTAMAPAMAGPREEVLARAAQCAALVDDAAWLACYHAAAAPMETPVTAASGAQIPSPAPVSSPVPAAIIIGSPAPASASPSDTARFGLADNVQRDALSASAEKFHSAPDTAATDHITAHILKYYFSSQKYFTLRLDNGQVWQQINGDDDFVMLQRPASEYEVTIRHGFFGGYNLTIAGVAGLFRVRRIG